MKKYIIALGLITPAFLFGQIDRSIRPTAGKAPSINIKDFKDDNKEVAFIDIAGRISLDNEMMNELKEIYSKIRIIGTVLKRKSI